MTGLVDAVWMPQANHGVRQVPVGRRFDVVEVPGPASARVLGLGWRSGPVVETQQRGVVRWFVVPGAAGGWPPPAGWCASPTEGGPPVRWVVPRGRCLTDADALARARRG